MNEFVVSLSDLSPGPACVIPEDKKIFRVTPHDTEGDGRHVATGEPAGAQAEVQAQLEAQTNELRLPVPHMYSA